MSKGNTMEPKQGLNNQQRKMLDEIYTDRFNAQSKLILKERELDYKKLKEQVLKTEMSSSPMKAVANAIDKARELLAANQEYMKEHGICNNTGWTKDSKTPLYLSDDAYNTGGSHPDLDAHRAETRRIEINLAEKKKEIRSRIYGMNTSYAEVDKEISEYIKDVE